MHKTIQELLDARIINTDHKKTLGIKDALLAELELSIPRDFDTHDTEQAQAVREKLLYWLEPSGWPESQ